jgi:hypothetical protein
VCCVADYEGFVGVVVWCALLSKRIFVGGGTLIDMRELLGFLKKSLMSFSWPIRGIASGNSRSKKVMRSCGVFNDWIIDSVTKSVHVNDLSFN